MATPQKKSMINQLACSEKIKNKIGCALGYRVNSLSEGARWRSARASDSESRDPRFDPHRRHHVVSLSKTH